MTSVSEQINTQNVYLNNIDFVKPQIFNYKNVEYEIIYNINTSELLFRQKDKPKCFIDFMLDYEKIYSVTGEFVRYKNILYINFFQCNVKGAGLKMLTALVKFLDKRSSDLNNIYNIDIIKLEVEPYDARSGVSKKDITELQKLVSYYKRIGFHIMNYNKSDIYENYIDKFNRNINPVMEVDFDYFLRKHEYKGGNKQTLKRRFGHKIELFEKIVSRKHNTTTKHI